jgi:DNA-binding CsgD family transcriptional regulator
MKHVLVTGKAVVQVRFRAQLHGRTEVGQWIGSYFPIRDASGVARRVGVILLEITAQGHFRRRLRTLGRDLRRSRKEMTRLVGKLRREAPAAAVLKRLHQCAKETELLSQLLQTALADADMRGHETGAVETPAKSGGKLLMAGSEAGERAVGSLSPREIEVIRLLAESKSNKEVASTLGISVKTAETYRARVMLKLDIHSIGGLVRFAVRHNLIQA